MNVLMVAFEFPPLANIGVRRPLQFARHLPEFGISPVIVTTDQAAFERSRVGVIDRSLLSEVPSSLKIERLPCESVRAGGRLKDWARIYFRLVGDSHASAWKPAVENRIEDILRAHQPEVIYVTIPPYSIAPLWCHIGQRYGIPVVLDFRDAWSNRNIGPSATWIHYKLTLGLERRCLQSASRVICTSDQTRQDLLALHPVIPAEKLTTITNGYDLPVDCWALDYPPPPSQKNFTIGYVGSYYYNPAAAAGMMQPWWQKKGHRMLQYVPGLQDWTYDSPLFFFRSVQLLLTKRPELRSRLRVQFVGNKPDWIDAQVQASGLQDCVDFLGLMNHGQCIDFQRGCDSLLVTSPKVVGGRDYNIKGKTYEYIPVHKPIIAFTPDGAQKDILAAAGIALICDPDDVEASALRLGMLIDGEAEFSPNEAFLKGLSRRELTARLAEVLRSAAGGLPALH